MVFSVFKNNNHLDVIVYDSIEDFIRRTEWQDIFEGHSAIIDENGEQYKWDDSKIMEFGTVYNYTLIPFTRDLDLAKKCNEYYKLNKTAEFTLENT
ncbi:MAG: hypothetical protein QM710_04950 [Flavobacterium sp.]